MRKAPIIILWLGYFVSACAAGTATAPVVNTPTKPAAVETTAISARPPARSTSPRASATLTEIPSSIAPFPSLTPPAVASTLQPSPTPAITLAIPLTEVSVMPQERTLSLQSPRLTGPDVLALQQQLTRLGYAVGEPDGIFGPITDTAVRAFQTDQGLTIDGIVGPQTWAALFGIAPIPLPGPRLSGFTVQQIEFPGAATQGFAFDGQYLWITQLSAFLSQVDRDALTVKNRLRLEGTAQTLLVAANHLWIGSHETGSVYVLDPASLEMAAAIAVGGYPSGLLYDGERVWAATLDAVVAIDPNTFTVIGEFHTGYNVVGAMAYDGQRLWLSDRKSTLYAYEWQTQKIRYRLENIQSAGMYFDGQRLWYSDYMRDEINSVDTATLEVGEPIGVAPGPMEIISDGERLWVMIWNGVQPVNPASAEAGEFLKLNAIMMNILFDGRRVWLSSTGELLYFITLEEGQ